MQAPEGSQTNASDAVDAPSLGVHPSAEDVLDEGVEETFPASDPVAVGSAYAAATRREHLASLRLHELHPTLVHFPLALFPASIVADLLGRLTGSRTLMALGRTLMPAASASAAAAGAAGLVAQQAVKAEGRAHEVLATHRNLNLGLIAASAVMAVARSRTERPGVGYLLAGLGAMAAMGYTAYLGGKMVYDHGVGVAPAGGVRDEQNVELAPGRMGEAARVSARHLAEGARHAARSVREGEIAPALTRGS